MPKGRVTLSFEYEIKRANYIDWFLVEPATRQMLDSSEAAMKTFVEEKTKQMSLNDMIARDLEVFTQDRGLLYEVLESEGATSNFSLKIEVVPDPEPEAAPETATKE